MIYAIQLRSGKQFIKFGHAKNVTHRLSSLQSASPYKLRLLGFGDWPDVEEARIHAYLWQYQACGEWFRPCEATDHVVALLVDPEGLDKWRQLVFGATAIPKRLAHLIRVK